jgi:spoIIIJ-associated protein
MEAVVRTARTVEEAEELALKELGVDRSEVEVEILSRGKSGFLGIGAELARVRVTRISEGGDVASMAVNTVNQILSRAKVNVLSTLRAAHDPEVGGPIIDLTGEDSGLLIGRRGQTLQALQFIVNLMVRKDFGENVRVVLDVEHYRQRREASLRDMATKVASRVVQTGRGITLEPMSAADRRVIHLSLANHQGVTTESVGFGEERKVTILPSRRNSDQPVQPGQRD